MGGMAEQKDVDVSSPPPIRALGCSDVWLALKADGQIAASDMCWESSQGRTNDGRGEAGRWLLSGTYTGFTVPLVWAESASTFR